MSVFKDFFAVENIPSNEIVIELTSAERLANLRKLKSELTEDIRLIDEQIENLIELQGLEEELERARVNRDEAKAKAERSSPVEEVVADIEEVEPATTLPTPAPGENITFTASDLNVVPLSPKGKRTAMAEALANAIIK